MEEVISPALSCGEKYDIVEDRVVLCIVIIICMCLANYGASEAVNL